MTLPRFFFRVADAITPIADLDPESLASHLDTIAVHIHRAPQSDAVRDRATLLAVNLASRLYPHVVVHGSAEWTGESVELARRINPGIDVTVTDAPPSGGPDDLTAATPVDVAALPARTSVHLRWDGPSTTNTVVVAAAGWDVWLDDDAHSDDSRPTHPLTANAAVCFGMAEVFRVAFAGALGARGRSGPQPGSFNLVSCGPADPTIPSEHMVSALPDATLVGAGAIGQACLLSLVELGATLTLTVVDPQDISLSNLQRYVLTDDASTGTSKTEAASNATAGTGIAVVPVPTPWGVDRRSGPGTAIVLCALDSAADRIAVAASLPDVVYNAWTQPADTGWSRHEEFGKQPCLACLYYPDRPRPNEHELIASALGQHPLRILTYLVTGIPVGSSLPSVANIPDLPAPPESADWMTTPLLSSLIADGYLTPEDTARWTSLPIGDLYRDGVCAGGLIRLPGAPQPDDALVPLAHQSALAGVMLTADFYVAHQPVLRDVRRSSCEARYDVLRGLPQTFPRPRQRTVGCLCQDKAYQDAASARP